jgi:hypothetical protein
MVKKLLKNKYFVILFIIVIILIVIKFISSRSSDNNLSSDTISTNQLSSSKTNSISNPSSNTSTQSNPSSNTTSNPTPTIKITEVNYQIPLNKFLPYNGKYFKATRYIKANNLEIKVFNRENTDLAKQEAQEWLVQNGVDKLDTFTVIY